MANATRSTQFFSVTDTFAAQYRETTEQIKESFIEAKTEVTVTVVAQSVMSASSTRARVLLFLNQFVTKDGGEALYSPYRAVATMEKTDRGWLVSKLETEGLPPSKDRPASMRYLLLFGSFSPAAST